MSPSRLEQAFYDKPEYLLALMLSSPAERRRRYSSVTIDFSEAEVKARVQNPLDANQPPKLLATKSTISAAILMYHLITKRGPEFADSLVGRVRQFSDFAARRHAEFAPHRGGSFPATESPDAESYGFFQQLDVGPADFEVAQASTFEALNFLESERLAIDPAFTPELMVLAGLIPVHFSVRTPKGERIYRQIRINAPMWSLDIARGRKEDRPFTDIEFRFRGIEIVKNALTSMATQYLESEENVRRAKGQPLLRRMGSPELDA